jgi:hypothetical protein
MPLAYLFDENVRGLPWRYVQRHNAHGRNIIDAVRVGDGADLPLGSLDPHVLLWAEREGRILISRDERTLPRHLADHLAGGRHSPGIFLMRAAPLADVLEFLTCAAYASEPAEWEDRVTFIP